MKNLLIADDHEVVRRGLKEIAAGSFDLGDVGEAENSDQLLALLEAKKWDLILLDILMPRLTLSQLLEEIRKRDAQVPILILTAISEPEYAVRALKAGANGYITKQYASEELIEAIRTVANGESYLSREAVSALADDVRSNVAEAPHDALSKRELTVFRMVAQGRAIKQIAFDLDISAKTVGTYVARIKAKTGLRSYVEITRYAIRHGLVD